MIPKHDPKQTMPQTVTGQINPPTARWLLAAMHVANCSLRGIIEGDKPQAKADFEQALGFLVKATADAFVKANGVPTDIVPIMESLMEIGATGTNIDLEAIKKKAMEDMANMQNANYSEADLSEWFGGTPAGVS